MHMPTACSRTTVLAVAAAVGPGVGAAFSCEAGLAALEVGLDLAGAVALAAARAGPVAHFLPARLMSEVRSIVMAD